MASPETGSVMADKYATVYQTVDHRGVRHLRYEFPSGSWKLGVFGYEDLMRDGHATRRGDILTLQGRRFVLVPHADPFMLPEFTCYPVGDWRSWLALAQFHALRAVDPLRMWLAFQCYYFGGIRMGDSAGWLDIARWVFVGRGDDTAGF